MPLPSNACRTAAGAGADDIAEQQVASYSTQHPDLRQYKVEQVDERDEHQGEREEGRHDVAAVVEAREHRRFVGNEVGIDRGREQNPAERGLEQCRVQGCAHGPSRSDAKQQEAQEARNAQDERRHAARRNREVVAQDRPDDGPRGPARRRCVEF